jgi:hypothetical protein
MKTLIALASLLAIFSFPAIAQDNGGVQDLSQHLVKAQSPFEQAAHAIDAQYAARYRTSDDAIDYARAFNALGALAGFGCQMAIREGFIKPGLLPENKAFVVIGTKDGGKYFFGDVINGCLFEGPSGQITVWALVGAAAKRTGATNLPDLKDIAAYNAKVLGSPAFGVPRVPERYRSSELPIDIVRRDWPAIQKLLADGKVDPRTWGWTVALAAQYMILEAKDRFDPGMAATIVMEAASPMSKIDPATVGVR